MSIYVCPDTELSAVGTLDPKLPNLVPYKSWAALAQQPRGGGRMGGGLMCWGGEPHNCKYKITNSVPKYIILLTAYS